MIHCDESPCKDICARCAKRYPAQPGVPWPFYEVELTREENEFANEDTLTISGKREFSSGLKAWSGVDQVTENHVLGGKIEVCVKKVAGVDMRLQAFDRGGDRDRGDVFLKSGKTVSCKGVRMLYPATQFAIHQPKTLHDDYAVLGVPAMGHENAPFLEIRRWWLLGHLSRQEYEKRKHPIRVPHGRADGVYHYEMDEIRIFFMKEVRR
jgi:hypothetical protein